MDTTLPQKQYRAFAVLLKPTRFGGLQRSLLFEYSSVPKVLLKKYSWNPSRTHSTWPLWKRSEERQAPTWPWDNRALHFKAQSQHPRHHFTAPSTIMERSHNLQLLRKKQTPPAKSALYIWRFRAVRSFSLSSSVCVMHAAREHLVFMLSIINYKCNSRSLFNTICECSQRLLSDWCMK